MATQTGWTKRFALAAVGSLVAGLASMWAPTSAWATYSPTITFSPTTANNTATTANFFLGASGSVSGSLSTFDTTQAAPPLVITSSALPNGLQFTPDDTNGTFVISGTPTGPVQATTVTVTATQGAELNASAPFTINVYFGTQSAVSGGGQSAQNGTLFSRPLQVQVLGPNQRPLTGVHVTFTAGTSHDASATFVDGNNPNSVVAVSGVGGYASSGAIRANSVGGSYTVTASANGFPDASFTLTNVGNGDGASSGLGSVSALRGTPQSTSPNSFFTEALEAKVVDAQNNPVQNAKVTFTVNCSPTSPTAACGTLETPGGGTSDVANTGADGTAIMGMLANGNVGSFTVTASVAGYTNTNAVWNLSIGSSSVNSNAVPQSIAQNLGDNQAAAPDTNYADALEVTVTDSNGHPAAAGTPVTFTIHPGTATGSFRDGSGSTSVGQGGMAYESITAGHTAGTFTVVASVPNATDANGNALQTTFSETVSSGATGTGQQYSGPTSVVPIFGDHQTATPGNLFSEALEVRVSTASGFAAAGTPVTFTISNSDASFVGTNGSTSLQTMVGGDGVATAAIVASSSITPASMPATFSVNAQVATTTGHIDMGASRFSEAVSYAKTDAGVPSSFSYVQGNDQLAQSGNAFAQALEVQLADSDGSSTYYPYGQEVDFTVTDANGAQVGTRGPTFDNGTSSEKFYTGMGGLVQTGVVTAGSLSGTYTVTASLPNSSLTFAFTLTQYSPS